MDVKLSANLIPIKCQLNANWVLMVWHYGSASSRDRLLGHFPICFDTHQLAEDQDHKGTPFEYFPGVLLTNEKPRFRALNQWEASILARFMACAKFWSIQCTGNRIHLNGRSRNFTHLPMEHQLRANGKTIYCQLSANVIKLNANWLQIKDQLTVNWMLLDCHLSANWMQIDCQLNANFCQLNAYRLSIECQAQSLEYKIHLKDGSSVVSLYKRKWPRSQPWDEFFQ